MLSGWEEPACFDCILPSVPILMSRISITLSLSFFLTNILTVELTEKVVSAAGSCSRLLAAGRRGSPHYVACLSQLPPGEKRSLSSGTPRKLPDHAVDTVVSFAAFPQRTPGSVQDGQSGVM